MAVRDGADAADALRDVEGVGRLAAHEHRLHAAVQAAGDPRVLDSAVLDLDLDPQVSLDAGDRVEDDACPRGAAAGARARTRAARGRGRA